MEADILAGRTDKRRNFGGGPGKTGKMLPRDPKEACDVLRDAAIQSQRGSAQPDWAAQVVELARLKGRAVRGLTIAVPGSRPEELDMGQCLTRLGCRVVGRWERGIPAFGAGHGGAVLTARDERGTLLEPEQLLPLLCLIEMEHGSGQVAVPDSASAAVELVTAGFGGTCLRPGRDGQRAREVYAAMPWLWHASFAAVRIVSRMALSGETLEELMAKTPRFSVRKREIPLNADQKQLLGALAQAHGGAVEGAALRVRTGNGWVCLSASSRRQAIRILAESPDLELAAELCDLYAGRVQRADRRICRGEK